MGTTRVSRREFLGTFAAAGAFAFGTGGRKNAPGEHRLVSPSDSGIEHIVVVMLENRSFDHFLGWLPGADGRQAGLVYTTADGAPFQTHPLAPDYQGCGHPDPDHSYAGGRIEYNGGRCDGWLRAGDNDAYAIGYYERGDLAFLGQQVPRWTTSDRYFAPIMASTYPNRIYQHAAQTDRIDNTPVLSSLPTIWDRLADRGISATYYYSDVPFLALWGAKYIPIARPAAEFFADALAGTLPQVAFVDPRFDDEQTGTSADDHPHADVRAGEAFLNQVYQAVTTGASWHDTVLVINYDEWGGFFDHVAPPRAPIPPADRAVGSDGLRGFRVPFMIVSPWSPALVSHRTYDHTSVLRLIEWRWQVQPLTVRDASANNPARELRFGHPRESAPELVVPDPGVSVPCAIAPASGVVDDEIRVLTDLASASGWPIY